VLYSWADVIGHDAFLDDIKDPQQRAETRARTVALFNLLDRRGCRHRALVGYFNQSIPQCGEACDACLALTLDDLFAKSTRLARAEKTLEKPLSWRTPSWRTAESQAADAEPDLELFDRLRVLRRRIADSESVPAYIVFSDAVLREMSRRIPKTERELMTISGIGPAKLTRYGKAFLEVLRSGSADDDA
jgi:ATP-dependent DNA helicase RecQ